MNLQPIFPCPPTYPPWVPLHSTLLPIPTALPRRRMKLAAPKTRAFGFLACLGGAVIWVPVSYKVSGAGGIFMGYSKSYYKYIFIPALCCGYAHLFFWGHLQLLTNDNKQQRAYIIHNAHIATPTSALTFHSIFMPNP